MNMYKDTYLIITVKKTVREMSRELGYSDKWVSKFIKNVILKEENIEKI